ncbi:ankyrin repeat, bromo and BTB domain-containing protein DDB_G0293800-like [Oppia nitens]|uniref:ankyrin repeat, bromo and BTB domain-containing protein DDB_G0293800-like n=1 Tax=Oppia nitens TaxID=1686743 RepID=UPI0023DBEA85|nr:ankyrin repeat, bromo and BTB domain-containing protein DDB_G0293800-like [Oppia nitens]
MADQSVNDKMSNLDLDKELDPELADYLMTDYDIQFLIDGQSSVWAHKSFLMKSCPVFRLMFSDEWLNESDGKPIEIRDTTPEAFNTMIEYIYTGELVFVVVDDSVNGLDHIEDVLKLADRYQLKQLTASVGQHLRQRSLISSANRRMLSELAVKYKLYELLCELLFGCMRSDEQLKQKYNNLYMNQIARHLVFKQIRIKDDKFDYISLFRDIIAIVFDIKLITIFVVLVIIVIKMI